MNVGPVPWGLMVALFAICVVAVLLYGLARTGIDKELQIAALRERLQSRVRARLVPAWNREGAEADTTTTKIIRIELELSGEKTFDNVMAIVTRITANEGKGYTWTESSAALRTDKNVLRNGGEPFHLRPGQPKLITLCSRVVGNTDTPRQIDFAVTEIGLESRGSLANTQDCLVEVRVVGVGEPLVLDVHLTVDATGELQATLSERAYRAPVFASGAASA